MYIYKVLVHKNSTTVAEGFFMQLKEDSLGMMIDQVRMLLIKKKNSRLLEYAFHKVAMSFVNTCFWAKKT